MPTIDTEKIPDYVARVLARETLNAVREFMAKPGGREFLKAKTEEIKLRRERGELKC